MAQSQVVRQAPRENGQQFNHDWAFRQTDRLDGWVEVVVCQLRNHYGSERLSLVLELRLYVHGRVELGESRVHLLLPVALLGRGHHVRLVYRRVVRLVD